MERQSTSKLFRALIAVVAFFVLCTSAILFASCGTDPLTCEHDLDGSKVVAITQGNCGTTGTVTYECSKCGAEVTVVGTLATGNHTWVNDRCSVCGISKDAAEGLTLQQVKDDLTTVLNTISGKVDTTSSGVNELTQKIVAALKSSDSTIPSLYDKLAEIKSALDALDFDFNIGDIELVADSSNGSTLGEVLSSLYKQVNALYNNYAKGVSQESLYDLLVGGTGTSAHVHNWVLELKKGTTYSCTTPNTYVWGCAFCDEVKDGDVTVMATGHATEFKTGRTDPAHHYAATCITPERVEGHCANCNEWTGEWTEVGQPTYEHHYVETTEVVTDTDKTGVCTSKVVSVYHCETCGGAYVANDSSSSSNDHNYYYVADEDGSNKRPMTDDEKIEVWNNAHPADQIKDLSELSVSETQELNELLKEGHLDTRYYGLNIVYYSAPTCVDPALIVVECMDCGVRYAYTFGEPEHHTFKQVEPKKDATCTMDGTRDYYYCDKCGYYFFFEDGDLVKDDDGKVKVEDNGEVTVSTTRSSLAYTRQYMTDLNGKVINDKTGTDEEKAAAKKAAYDRATEVLPALGHDFVPVYINTQNCVTAQDYILVCQRCFKNGEHSFKDCVKVGEATDQEWQLFYQKDANSPYSLKGLDNNTTDDLAGLLKKVTDLATKDDAAAKAGDTSDLSKEWAALDQDDKVSVFAWLGVHGYLVRDPADDEVFGNISVATAKGWYGTDGKLKETAKTEINGYLTALGTDFDLATLYNGYSPLQDATAKTKVAGNVLLGPAQAKNDPDTKVAVVNAFELPVVGHKFNDKFELVVGNCVMYERHVYFCSECGQKTGDPDATTDESGKVVVDPPYKSVTGDDDFVVAGYTDKASAPKGYKTDLDLSWDAVCALEDLTGSAQLIWLTKYGYLNDYLDSDSEVDWSEINPLLGAEGLEELDDEYAHFMELNIVMQRAGTYGQVEDITDFFTHENVLKEYKVVRNFAGGQETPVELGHKFTAVTLLNAEACDAPGQYVYICSVCGAKTAPSSKTTLTYQSGEETVDTLLPLVDGETNRTYLTDQEQFEAAIAEENRGEGKTYTKTDLQLDWETKTTEADRFDWLLNHGYLNNIIDTYYTDGYTLNDELKGGYLAKALEAAQKAAPGELVYVDSTMYATARGEVYTDGVLSLTDAEKADILAIAKDLAKKASHTVTGGTDGDITVYYTHSADTYQNEKKEDVKDTPANKTIDFAATEIPIAGHIWRRENGTVINLKTDPLCTDYKSAKLKEFYDAGKMVAWDSAKGEWVQATDKEGNELTFDKNDIDKTVRDAIEKYGILGACGRNNCPYHTKYDVSAHTYDKATKDGENGIAGFTAGFYPATDHVMSYEKYVPNARGTSDGCVEVETVNDGEHVYYNFNDVDAYKTAAAAKYLPSTVTGADDAAKWAAASVEQQTAAAQAAMDADLLNLHTLQKIWNSLFIPTEWLNPTDEATAQARQDKYPTYTFGADVLTDGKVDLVKLQALFDEVNVPVLWEKISSGLVSVWRPMNDNGNPSCWVSLRCNWYHYTDTKNPEKGFTGKLCSKWEGSNAHDFPYLGDFGYDTHVANCQHKDICDSCGEPIGTKGNHHLLKVSPDDESQINDDSLKAAWIEVLKAFNEGKVEWLNGVIELSETAKAADFDWTKFDWENDWSILEDTCYEGDETGAGKEVGNNIYVCTGELEVIYNAMVKGDADGNKQTWDQTMGTEKGKVNWTTSDKLENTVNNYFIEEVDTAEHSYEIKYYLGGVEYTETQWNEGWTDEDGNYHYAVKFDRQVCEDGYYTELVCENDRRDGERCSHVKPDSRVTYESVGHALAPVENYWEDSRYKEPGKDGNTNAIVHMVCVVCGMTFDREWGDTTPGEGDRNQYVVATESQIGTWNDYVDLWNADDDNFNNPKYKAQLIRTDDVVTTTELPEDGAASGTQLFEEGVNVFKGETTVKVQDNKKPTEEGAPEEYWDTTYADVSGDITVLVGKDDETNGTLKFEAGTHSTKLSLRLGGKDSNVSFVGEGPDETSIDFTNVDEVILKGALDNESSLTFKDITVNLGDKFLDDVMLGDTTLTFENVVVKSNGTAIRMNATDAENITQKIVIKDSTFISENGVGFANWLSSVQITATNSTFVGAAAGAFIRSGNATFTDCTFATKGTAGSTNPWGQATSIDATGALVVGNKTEVEAYGNATVTLENCTFGTYTTTYDPETELGACSDETPAVNAFSSAKNETVVDFDVKSTINANGFVKENPGKATNPAGEEVSTLTVKYTAATAADFGADDDERTANAAKLVESLAKSGGVVELPENFDFSVSGETPLEIADGVELELSIGEGSQVDLAKGLDVKGKLTVEGDGTLLVQKRTSGNIGVLVDGANAELNIKGGNLSVSSGENVNGAPYAIYAKNGATVNVSNSVVYSSVGKVLGTNAQDTTSAKFILINSAFINDTKTADASEGNSFAVLVNNKNAEIYAGGCTFYGTSGAVWVRAAKKAVFAGCTFVGGGVASTETNWGAGATLPKEVLAVLVIGNGQGDAYGAVDATITDCTVETVTAKAAGQGQPTTGVNSDVYEWDTEKGTLKKGTGKVAVPGYGKSATATIADANTKLFSVVAYNSTKTTVAFSDLNTAKAFIGGEALTKGTNAFFCGTATRNSFDVKYDTTPGTGEATYASIKINEETAPDAGTAADTLKDVLANGGELTFTAPAAEAQGKTLTVSSDTALTVAEDTTINLNGNTLAVTNGIKVSDDTALTVKGGSVTANVTVLEEGNVTLNDVDLTGGINLTYPAEEEATASTAHITLTGSTVTCSGTETADTPLYVNGNVDGATVTLENSEFLSNNGLALWIAGKTTIVATNCLFYGSVAAVQVCSGDVTFENCTFVTSSDDKWTSSNEEVTWFGSGSNGFPKETRANLVINAKGGGYDVPVTVTVKGEKTEFAVLEKVTDYAPSNVLKAGEADETKTTKLENFDYYYKKAAEATVSKISVAVVSAKASEATSALVKLTVTDVEVAFKLGQNVFVYTTLGNADSKTAATEDKTVTPEVAQKVIEGLTGLEARAE